MSDDEKAAIVQKCADEIRQALDRANAAGMPAHLQFSICIACAVATAQAAAISGCGRQLNAKELENEFMAVLGGVETRPLPRQGIGSHEGKPS